MSCFGPPPSLSWLQQCDCNLPFEALLYYDYALTFPSEVKYIWQGQRLTLITPLYILCRYALVANVLYLLAIGGELGQQVGIIACIFAPCAF